LTASTDLLKSTEIPNAEAAVISTKQDYDDLIVALNLIRGANGIENTDAATTESENTAV
jgi:hypothetical protein